MYEQEQQQQQPLEKNQKNQQPFYKMLFHRKISTPSHPPKCPFWLMCSRLDLTWHQVTSIEGIRAIANKMQNRGRIWLIAILTIIVTSKRIFSFRKGQINLNMTQNLGQRKLYPTFC